MSRRYLNCVLVFVFCLMSTVQGGSIIWVDEGAAGGVDGWQTLLEGAGHTVTQMSDMGTLDADKIAALNAADLVIVSRDTNSGNYDDGDEVTEWNSITSPLILTSSYLVRSSRWEWVDSTSLSGVGGGDLMVVEADHPIFKGVAAKGDEVTMLTGQSNMIGETDGGNGQILGKHTDGRLWIVYWEAGTAFHSGTDQVPAAPRMWLCGGSNSDPKGGMKLTDEGQAIFLNAIAFVTGGVSNAASSPMPGDAGVDVIRDSVLSWVPNDYAGTHDVYFGASFDDVNTMTVPTAAGLDVNSFDPGRLEFGQTYFWRVDEVNSTPDKAVFKGKVWSFTAEPYSIQIAGDSIVVTASSSSNEFSTPERTVDGSGLGEDDTHGITAEDQWFTASVDLAPWIQYEFDDIKKLDVMKVWNSNSAPESGIGWGVKDVEIEYSVDGNVWAVLADANQFSQAPGSPAYNQYDEIDFGGAAAKYVRLNIQSNWGGILMSYGLSEVQFDSIPVVARSPKPASGSVDVLPDAVVTWRAGRDADQHMIYLGTDQNEVVEGLAASVTSSTNSLSLSSLDLELGQTYYWRVDEVNEAEATAAWAGPVWSLTLVDALTVDDFESYGNVSPDRPFQVWLDGYGYSADEFFPAGYGGNGTGAGIGHDIWSLNSPHYDGQIMETNVTIAGSGQSMPFYYGNSGGVASETQRAFDSPQDWTSGGAQTLSIAFRGQAGNTGTLYVKINNTKVTYQLDAANIAIGAWQVWNIDLTQVAGNLNSVSSMSIGVDGANASGMILIDDIRLYAQPGELITPVAPDGAGLLAQYSFEGNANDSSGNGLNGQMTGSQVASPGAMNQGSAVQITPGGYVDLGNPASLDFGTGDWTVAAWFKTGMTGTGDENKGTIVGKGGDSGGGHRYALIMSETTEGVVSLVTDDNVTKYVVDATSMSNDGQWHFVAGQREGSEIRIFIDGQLEATATADPAYDLSGTSQHNAYIGTITNNGSGTLYKMLEGSVDEVAIYGRALSAEEILWMAGRTTPVEKPF